ncbi:MAG: AAA family ATPase [Clostridia bacterium]|nr:AAA family ATPase [Clostridia bacterium]
MRIQEILIDGFGVFAGQRVKDIGPGVVVFSGPNEAGKTTLMSFIRGVLFGYENKASRFHYPPLAGGRHGGALTVAMSDGSERRIERYVGAPRASSPDVPVGISKAFYSNVFAFGLSELASISSLGSEEVSARIYSAGAGLGAASLPRARADLGRAIDALYKPSGSTPEINRIIASMQSAEHEISALLKAPKEYNELIERIKLAQEEARAATVAADAARRLELWLTSLLRTRDTWEAMLSASRSIEQLRDASRGDEARRASLASVAAGIRELERESTAHARLMRSLPALEAALAERRATFADRLKDLGPSWDEDRLDRLDTSAAAVEEVRRHRGSAEDAARILASAEERERSVGEAVKDAEKRYNDARRRAGEQESGRGRASDAGAAARRLQTTGALGALAAAAAGLAVAWGRSPTVMIVAVTVGAAAAAVILWSTRRAVARDEADRRAEIGAELASLAADALEARKAWERHHEEAEKARRAVQAAQDRWSHWLAEKGLDPSYGHDAALVAMDGARKARGVREEIRLAAEAESMGVQQADSYASSVSAVLAGLGLDPVGRCEAGEAISRLAGELDAAIAVQEAAARAEERRQGLVAQFDSAFPEDQRAAARREHAASTREELEARADSAMRDRVAREKDATDSATALGGLEQERRTLEASDELASAEARRAALDARLRKRLLEWASYRICQGILTEACDRYERERQPAVMRHASTAFSTMTGGRWESVIAPMGGLATLEAVMDDGRRLPSDRMSQSAEQQLYLSVRCGLVREYCAHAEPMPVAIDDILVNFDPERASAAAQVLSQLSDVCQVLVFTCHPHVVQQFRATGRVTREYSLEGGTILTTRSMTRQGGAATMP